MMIFAFGFTTITNIKSAITNSLSTIATIVVVARSRNIAIVIVANVAFRLTISHLYREAWSE